MARDTKQNTGIAWSADPEATEYLIFYDTTDDPTFLAQVDAGDWPEFDRTTELQWLFPDGHPADADHAVVSTDGDGRYSSPHSPNAWQDIPLARPPLAGPTGGVVLSAG